MSLFKRRKPAQELHVCPRCGQLVEDSTDECALCGWDIREAYRGPIDEAGERTSPA